MGKSSVKDVFRTRLLNSEHQWLQAQDLYEIGSINIPSWTGKRLTRLCPSLRTYSHITLAVTGTVTFFNGVVTGKLPLLKYIIA